MNYHAITDRAALITGAHYWYNCSLDYLLSVLVIPYVNGQVVLGNRGKKGAVVNLAATAYLQIYRTDREISPKWLKALRLFGLACLLIRMIGRECTKEVLDTARVRNAGKPAQSLLQAAFSKSKRQVFVVMKFGDKTLNSAYEGVIRPIAEEYGFKSLRIDEVQDSGRITDQILEEIATSEVVYCDLSGERPNCYYEAGFAHAIGKECVFAIHKGHQVHFDLAAYRFIEWETEMELRRKLRSRFAAIANRH